MNTSKYAETILNALVEHANKHSLSSGVKQAIRNIARYYLAFIEQEQHPRQELNMDILKRAVLFCSGPLPSSLSATERVLLTKPGQRDYFDAEKYLHVVLPAVLKKNGQ